MLGFEAEMNEQISSLVHLVFFLLFTCHYYVYVSIRTDRSITECRRPRRAARLESIWVHAFRDGTEPEAIFFYALASISVVGIELFYADVIIFYLNLPISLSRQAIRTGRASATMDWADLKGDLATSFSFQNGGRE